MKPDFQDYTVTFEIPTPHVNPYNKDGDAFHLFSRGYEDNISNVYFSISLGNGKEVSIGDIKLRPIKSSLNGDANNDGVVDVADIATVISVMSTGSTNLSCDVNSDGVIDVSDISAIISNMSSRILKQNQK